MVYILVPLMLVVAAALALTWWDGRIERDPVSSIDSFHRALEAMQPESAAVGAPQASWSCGHGDAHALETRLGQDGESLPIPR